MSNFKKAFTLIELMVVIAIIGILSSIVITNLNISRQKGRDAKRVGDINQIKLALELYADQNRGYYPARTADLTTYIAVIPNDPNGTPYKYQPTGTAVGGKYPGYHLGAVFEVMNTSLLLNDSNASPDPGNASDFNGGSNDCVASAAVSPAPGLCYDVVSQ